MGEKFPEDAPREQEMTVDQKRYKDLFHSWRMAGKKGKGEEKLPLRVENLRDSYELFQMKPVAVIRGNTFFDLTDGTRVAEKSLAEYSATVFRVDRPWDKWGKAMTAAGIRPGEECEVRYYMYDFIKDAIYARVNQAFSWCRRKGLIAETLPPDSVDILGRAYVINRRGGRTIRGVRAGLPGHSGRAHHSGGSRLFPGTGGRGGPASGGSSLRKDMKNGIHSLDTEQFRSLFRSGISDLHLSDGPTIDRPV